MVPLDLKETKQVFASEGFLIEINSKAKTPSSPTNIEFSMNSLCPGEHPSEEPFPRDLLIPYKRHIPKAIIYTFNL